MIIRKIFISLLTAVMAVFFYLQPVYAHPGKTSSDGCHFCKSNCESSGYTYNTRHGHNGEICDPSKGPINPLYNGGDSNTNTSVQPIPTTIIQPAYPTNTPKPLPTKIPTPKLTVTPIIIPTLTIIPTKIPTPTISPTPSLTPTITITSTIFSTIEISPTLPIPSPSLKISVSIFLSPQANTQSGGVSSFFSGIFRGILNILSLNKFNKHILSPVPATPTPAPTIEPSPIATETAVPTLSQVLGLQLKTSNCKANGALPDRECTPGDVIKDATKEQICVPGYTKTVRNVSQSLKNKVYEEYSITTHQTGDYEVDHLIPLELGGSNDISNLFPEASEPRPGYHEKDKLENYLHSQVCKDIISLNLAQQEIAADWLSVYNQLK